MTVDELIKLIGRHRVFAVCIPIFLVFLTAVYVYMLPYQYQATVVLSASGELRAIESLVVTDLNSYEDVSSKVVLDTRKKTITIKLIGESESLLAYSLDASLENIVADVNRLYPDVEIIVDNDFEINKKGAAGWKYLVISFIAGVALTIFLLVLKDTPSIFYKDEGL